MKWTHDNPVQKVCLQGVSKNAVLISPEKPLGVTPPEDVLGKQYILRFCAGSSSGELASPVVLSVKSGGVAIGSLQLEAGKSPGWQEVSMSYSPSLVSGSSLEISSILIELDREAENIYVSEPRLILENDARARPSVYFILVDATRADAVGAYGDRGKSTPNMDSLAKDGVLFERCYTSSPFTLTSVASIFTGLHPWNHRVIFAKDAGLVFRDEIPTLIEDFKRAGYHTAAFSGTYFFMSKNGYAKGFDHFDETCADDFFRGGAECLSARVVPWVEAHVDEPVLVYVHYIDPHAPYYAPPRFRDAAASGLPKPGHEDVVLGEIEQFGSNRKWYQALRKPDAADLEYLRAMYDAELEYVDEEIGKLLKAIDQRRLAGGPEPFILLTADHGEAFYEHGAMDHVADLHDPVMRVPFILKGPGLPKGERAPEAVRTIDYLPTLLDLAGISPSSRTDGVSLRPLLEGDSIRPQPAAAVHFLEGKKEYALVYWPWKIFHLPDSGTTSLYDLEKDPGEHKDMSALDPERSRAMLEYLEAILPREGDNDGTASDAFDLDTWKRLEELGYIDKTKSRRKPEK